MTLASSCVSSSSYSTSSGGFTTSTRGTTTQADVISSTSGTAFSSLSAAPAASGIKLSTIEVFRQMANKMCLIEGEQSKSSGFFCTCNQEEFIVTVFHVVSKNPPLNDYSLEHTTMKIQERKYKVLYPKDFNFTRAEQLDICLLKPEQEMMLSCFNLLPDSQPIVEGMKVYFAGYPLTLSNITFHKGTISGVFRKNGIEYFTIDGTVVPGNSGGPVVVQIEGKLYLIGVIFSEVVDLDPRFLLLESLLATFKTQGGCGGAHGIPSPDGTVHSINNLDMISVSLSAMKKNMSTGIGKAIHVKHLLEVVSTQVPSATMAATTHTSTDDLLVAKKRKLEQELRKNGWEQGHGAKHDIWTKGVHQTTVPRHTEISDGVAQSIRDAITASQVDENNKDDG